MSLSIGYNGSPDTEQVAIGSSTDRHNMGSNPGENAVKTKGNFPPSSIRRTRGSHDV
jgi:hypothetical protein